MGAYSELYVNDIVRRQGKVFLNIRNILSGVDEKWFIETYMKSRLRLLLDEANPKFANMPSIELIYWFINEEQRGKYKYGDEWGGFLPQWAGMIYSYYQWKYNVPSYKLIDLLPLSEIERIFPALHQAGLRAAVEKIHDEILAT